ncbi:hypothetical protein [Streptomyces sp. NPDC008137]|uniref:hypothetical protein n=1 Tax=Streptomyces sp. NPDC008137 TaxID=3364813 RepID=UPI0036E8447C
MPFQSFNALNGRADGGPLLGRDQLRNRTLWLCMADVLAVSPMRYCTTPRRPSRSWQHE